MIMIAIVLSFMISDDHIAVKTKPQSPEQRHSNPVQAEQPRHRNSSIKNRMNVFS